ncbi:LTA synthase family protein, partial [Levilactobacillus acidifarinae]|uniref:LTA synthase family protein n=3 Tax=Levilactobacillus acidifarinae TaxID=267364 RepID=UPI0035F05594
KNRKEILTNREFPSCFSIELELCPELFGFRNYDLRISRIVGVTVILLTAICGYGFFNAQKKDTLSYKVAHAMGNNPLYLNPEIAVETNGPIVNFFNNMNIQVMDKPDRYSKATMAKLVARYTKISRDENKTRTGKKQKVVFILSESFSDPTKVPGIRLNHDPIPYTRNVIRNGVGGNMISDGYGGGTANMEYQALTGLSLGNFSATLPTPYTQLVVHQTKTFSINNLFSRSMAIHPYEGTLYSRKAVFKKMQFNEFNYLKHGYTKPYIKTIDKNPYVSDRAVYKNLINTLKSNKNSDFIQLSTMQNHMPYSNYYKNNRFKVTGNISAKEKAMIETYAQGINYTDSDNRYLLKQLKKMKQNITVVFYGDHLPSIYNHVNLEKYGVAMHETPYFIWSNHLSLRKTAYQSMIGTYSFANEMQQVTNTQTTPYYALLKEVTEKLPIIASKVSTTSADPNLPSGGMNLINRENGAFTSVSKLTTKQKQLLKDYQLVQYDFTAGKHYALSRMTR